MTNPGALMRSVLQTEREHVLPGFRRLSATHVHVKSQPKNLFTDADRGAGSAAE